MAKKLTLERKQSIVGWGFLLPASLLIFIFCFYPMLQAVLLSFKRGNNAAERWVGFANYTRLFKDKVKSVRGIVVEDAEGKEVECDVETLTMFPNATFNSIINETAVHLITSYTLNENEEKN